MIKSIRHKGLRLYWERGQTKGLPAQQLPRIGRMLQVLDAAEAPGDLDLPGYHFHPLKGREAGRYSLRVTGNYRLTFAFDGIDVAVLDYEDYH